MVLPDEDTLLRRSVGIVGAVGLAVGWAALAIALATPLIVVALVLANVRG